MIERLVNEGQIWLPALGAGGLAVVGVALMLYASGLFGIPKLLVQVCGWTALGAALATAVLTWGQSRYLAGVAGERAVWTHKAEIVRAEQQAARIAVESFGQQIADSVEARIASLPETISKEILDAARAEDEKPVPENCRDVYRGLPPGVLQRLDQIR